MTIPLKHLNALDIISVLLFSLLANFILPIKIDFSSSFDFIELTRLALLSTSSILFYMAVSRLKEIAGYSRAEYEAETSVSEQARRSVELRYRDYCHAQGGRLLLSLAVAIVSGVMFFLVLPVIEALN